MDESKLFLQKLFWDDLQGPWYLLGLSDIWDGVFWGMIGKLKLLTIYSQGYILDR